MHNKKAKKIALDTNMLTAIVQLKINVFEEIRDNFGKVDFYLPAQVKKEIENLAKRNSTKKFAVISELLCRKNNVKVVEIEAKDADKALEKLAGQGYIVATNDRELRRKIGKGVIFIRQRKFIIAE